MFQAVMSMNAMALLAIAAITGAGCYIFWYKALNMTGVSRTMALNDTYVLWGLVFTALFSAVRPHGIFFHAEFGDWSADCGCGGHFGCGKAE